MEFKPEAIAKEIQRNVKRYLAKKISHAEFTRIAAAAASPRLTVNTLRSLQWPQPR